MGKRKTKRKAPPKRKTQKLDKEFNCPICFSDKTVEVHLNHKAGVASTLCRACRNSYEATITPIDAEIDVFSAWVDAVEDGTAPGAQQSVLAEDLAAIPQSRKASAPTKRQRVEQSYEYVEEEDEEDDDNRYLGEDDDVVYSRPSAPPPSRVEEEEQEIELPDEEEEYDFGDDDDEGSPEAEDDGGGPAIESPPGEEEEAPTWDD